jgi:hypothetical protein
MFLTVSSGLNGTYFVILADNLGVIERVDCCNFAELEEAQIFAERLAKEYKVRYVQ